MEEVQALSPGEIEARFGVSVAQQARWRRAGIIAPARTTGGGHARYGTAEIRALRLAHALQRGGLSQRRIRRVLPTLAAEVHVMLAAEIARALSDVIRTPAGERST